MVGTPIMASSSMAESLREYHYISTWIRSMGQRIGRSTAFLVATGIIGFDQFDWH